MLHETFVVPFVHNNNGLHILVKVKQDCITPLKISGSFTPLSKTTVGEELNRMFGCTLFSEVERMVDVDEFENETNKSDVIGFGFKSQFFAQGIANKYFSQAKSLGYCEACVMLPAKVALEVVSTDKWVIESLIDYAQSLGV
ncbi:MAG: hypothetical protein ACRCTW_11205 [Lactococcus garvieae]